MTDRRMIAFSVLYGLLLLNYIDLIGIHRNGLYHLWLTSMYFAPYIPLVITGGIRQLWNAISYGLITSLMNDLFYPIGKAVFYGESLASWYSYTFGFSGLESLWRFKAGLVTFDVPSILMGTSIYIRALIVYLIVSGKIRAVGCLVGVDL